MYLENPGLSAIIWKSFPNKVEEELPAKVVFLKVKRAFKGPEHGHY